MPHSVAEVFSPNDLRERVTSQKKHERAFEMAQNESRQHFHRCPSYNKYVCDSCGNENEGLCTDYAPRQEFYVAKTRADSMKCNIDSAGRTATV